MSGDNGNGNDPNYSRASEINRAIDTANEACLEVMVHGARTHRPADGWFDEPAGSHVEAAIRHAHAYLRGEEADPESGLSHLAHFYSRAKMATAVANKPN